MYIVTRAMVDVHYNQLHPHAMLPVPRSILHWRKDHKIATQADLDQLGFDASAPPYTPWFDVLVT